MHILLHKILKPIHKNWLLFFCLIQLSACGIFSTAPKSNYHTVRQSETLYRVAKMYGLPPNQLALLNNIKSPYTIYPGQILRLTKKVPIQTRKSTEIQTQPTKAQPTNPGDSRFIGQTISSQAIKQSKSNADLKWQWPSTGQIINVYSQSPKQQGIDIKGTRGQAVYAAADGQVIYAGDGILGFGNLLIIKHNAAYLSAYAHNQKILVKENQSVTAGQIVAEMGDTGTDQVKLHFQIRNHGKPINPMPFLPALR